jgi:pimeloyl-ACP methyl ester carboxylesterase
MIDLIKGDMFKFKASDGLILYGFLIRPKQKSDTCILNIHGLQGSFYIHGYMNGVAKKAVQNNINFCSISLRGSYNRFEAKKKKGKNFVTFQEGGDVEKFIESVYDIEGAIKALHSVGIKNIFLEGHSSGCQKITYYQYLKKDKRVKGLILIAPADDYNVYKKNFGKKFNEVVDTVKKIAQKDRNQRIPKSYKLDTMSAARFLSLVDSSKVESRIFNYELPKLKEFSAIKVPTIAFFGTKEQYAIKLVSEYMNILSKNSNSNFTPVIIKGANHGFWKREDVLADYIVKWIKQKNKN